MSSTPANKLVIAEPRIAAVPAALQVGEDSAVEAYAALVREQLAIIGRHRHAPAAAHAAMREEFRDRPLLLERPGEVEVIDGLEVLAVEAFPIGRPGDGVERVVVRFRSLDETEPGAIGADDPDVPVLVGVNLEEELRAVG